MRAWTSPEVPRLTASDPAPAVRVHDTATGARESHRAGGTARMYVCGITPYDATHIGHAATYVAFDLLNRAWRDAGHEVHYVQNVTDVDDPLLERAAATGDGLGRARRARDRAVPRGHDGAARAAAGRTTSAPSSPSRSCRADPAAAGPRASSTTSDGDLYFSVHADPRFGEVSGLDRGRDARGVRRARRRPRPARQEGPARLPAVAGRAPGRAGLGLAVSAAAGRAGTSSARRSRCTTSAASFDVQGGGSDLVFPHHEMSASEAQAAIDGLTFARPTCTPGWSASRARRCRSPRATWCWCRGCARPGVDPMAIRLALLAPPLPQRLGVDRRPT